MLLSWLIYGLPFLLFLDRISGLFVGYTSNFQSIPRNLSLRSDVPIGELDLLSLLFVSVKVINRVMKVTIQLRQHLSTE